MKNMLDTFFLEGLEVDGSIGVTAKERRQKQKLWIDLELSVDAGSAAKTDCVGDAVDYERVAKVVRGLASRSSFCLIETLAENIADTVLKNFSVSSVQVSVAKKGAVPFLKQARAVITRP